MFQQDSVSSTESPEILSLPPFVEVQGVINIRHIGGYSVDTFITKPNTIFRSGELNNITDSGKEQLVALGVKHIFDLRSPGEIASYKSATPVIEGVTVSHVPASLQGFDPVSLVSRYAQECFLLTHLTMLPD